MLTFQSAVDNTVTARAIVTLLYSRLTTENSKLVVYDINRSSTALHLMKTQLPDVVEYFEASAPLDFTVTVVRNRDRSSNALDAYTLARGDTRAAIGKTELAWPPGIYSLSHIAIPFRPDDILYGDGTVNNREGNDLKFGALAPRGEAKALTEWIDTL